MQPESPTPDAREVLPRIAGRCPSCGNNTLFLGSGGHVTCSLIGCKDPCAADDLLHPPSSGEQEGEVCKSCHRPVAETCPTYWQADDDLWNEVEGGPAGIRCIPCFTRDAQARGILISWRAVREATAGEVADAPAETQEDER